MDILLASWPYLVAVVAAVLAGLAVYQKKANKGWKTALESVVAGVHAGKQKLDEQGIDYKENLTTLIDANVTDPKAKKLLESVITIVETKASAASPTEEKPDAGSND
jgi:hypothetical protein